MILIKAIDIFSPDSLGKKDVLVAGETIEMIDDDISIPHKYVTKVIDGSGKMLVPGFIDSHVHILGGGGEGGYKTRTPEIQLTSLTTGGITTVVGCIGTDGITRNMTSLVAKVRGLEEEGISAFCYTGSYDVPVRTLTGDIRTDILIVDKIVGVGEVAVSDHRSSQPSIQELKRLTADARVGGILSGKAGVVNIHLGDGSEKLQPLISIVKETEIPITQFLPTHINRSKTLLEASIEWGKMNGYLDLTTSSDPNFLEEDELRASTGLKMLIEAGVSIENIGFSSDAQGSLPLFNSKGEFVGLGIGSAVSLFAEVKEAILNEKIPLEDAIRVITSNPARILKLKRKGWIKESYDADLVLLDKDTLEINTVIAKGRIMIDEGGIIIKGTFE